MTIDLPEHSASEIAPLVSNWRYRELRLGWTFRDNLSCDQSCARSRTSKRGLA